MLRTIDFNKQPRDLQKRGRHISGSGHGPPEKHRHSSLRYQTTSPLRCHLYPPMKDSRSPWTSSRGPVKPTKLHSGRWPKIKIGLASVVSR